MRRALRQCSLSLLLLLLLGPLIDAHIFLPLSNDRCPGGQGHRTDAVPLPVCVNATEYVPIFRTHDAMAVQFVRFKLPGVTIP